MLVKDHTHTHACVNLVNAVNTVIEQTDERVCVSVCVYLMCVCVFDKFVCINGCINYDRLSLLLLSLLSLLLLLLCDY